MELQLPLFGLILSAIQSLLPMILLLQWVRQLLRMLRLRQEDRLGPAPPLMSRQLEVPLLPVPIFSTREDLRQQNLKRATIFCHCKQDFRMQGSSGRIQIRSEEH